jgi:acyl carrier protein
MFEKSKFINLLEGVLELDKGELKGGENLDDLIDWDSLSIMGFIAMADENYDVTISTDELANCENIEDLIDIVQNYTR